MDQDPSGYIGKYLGVGTASHRGTCERHLTQLSEGGGSMTLRKKMSKPRLET